MRGILRLPPDKGVVVHDRARLHQDHEEDENGDSDPALSSLDIVTVD